MIAHANRKKAKTPEHVEDLTPAVAYIRMSTDKQEASPKQQRDEIAKLAKQLGCHILREYIDEGISGVNTKKRGGFNRMLVDAQKEEFKVILAWDQSRFARLDSIDMGEIVAPLRRAGVKMVTVTQGEVDWTNFANRMMFAIQSEQNNQYLHHLSAGITRARRANAKKGISQAPQLYGYDREIIGPTGTVMHRVNFRETFTRPKGWATRMVPSADSESVSTVRMIFQMVGVQGMSLLSVARELNSLGIRSPKGGRWGQTSVDRLVRNRAYVGDCVSGERSRGKFSRLGEIIVVPNSIPPLVKRSLFDRTQKHLDRLRDNRSLRAKASSYVLSGLCICGCCGRKLIGKTATRGRYYGCCRAEADAIRCPGFHIKAEKLEAATLRAIEQRVLTSANIEQIRAAAVEKLLAMQETGSAQSLRARAAELEGDLKKGMNNLARADADTFEGIASLVNEWRSELKLVQRKLQQSDTTKPVQVLAAEVAAHVEAIRQAISDGDARRARMAVGEVIERIVVSHPAGTKKQCHEWSVTIMFRDVAGLSPLRMAEAEFAPMTFTQSEFAPTSTDKAAAAVLALYKGEPVSTTAVAKYQGRSMATASTFLCRALQRGIVGRVGHGRWVPVATLSAATA